MGLIRASVQLLNPSCPDVQGLEATALADSGAVHLCIPEHLALQLKLRELERREVVLADGSHRSVPLHGARGGALREPPLLHRRHGVGG